MYLTTKKSLILFAFLLEATFLFGYQGGDPDVAWYESFFRKKKEFTLEQDLASASNKLRLASERRDMPTVVRSLNEIGLTHLTRTNLYDQAIDALMRALAIEDSLDLKHENIFTYLTIAQVFEAVGEFPKSEELLQEALILDEQSKNVHVLVLLLNELGTVHAAMGR